MRFGWLATGLIVMGSAAAGFGISIIWGAGALLLGRRYEILRARQEAMQRAESLPQPAQV